MLVVLDIVVVENLHLNRFIGGPNTKYCLMYDID